jgi:hypothetical protein
VARWLADMGRRREAIAWLEGLPAAAQADAIVADTAAELAAEEQDFPRLDRLLRGGAWGTWPDEARILALASRLETLRFDAGRGRGLWGDAVAASADSLHGLRALVRLANAWRDPEGSELALRKILDRDPRIFWAYDALRTSYVARGDLEHLLELYGQWVREDPDNREVTAQWILLSCILNRGTSEAYPRATGLTTDSPAGTLARAAVLWRQGQFETARSLLLSLPEARRREPAAAFWVALVAADLNLRDEAAKAIDDARKLPLPAEQSALLQNAAEKAGVPYQ